MTVSAFLMSAARPPIDLSLEAQSAEEDIANGIQMLHGLLGADPIECQALMEAELLLRKALGKLRRQAAR